MFVLLWVLINFILIIISEHWRRKVFLVKIPAAFPCSSIWKKSNSCYLQELLQGGQIWHYQTLELDNQDISNFRPSLYVIEKQNRGKYELELILWKQCFFFLEEHNGHWAVSKAPSCFLLACSKNYQTVTAEGATSKCVLCCSHISTSLCGLQGYFQRLVSTKQMCNSCIICLTPWVFKGIRRILPVPTGCQWQKKSKRHSAVSVLTPLVLILICSNASATSGWMFPQEPNSLSSVSVWYLCVRGLNAKMILETKPIQPRIRWLLPVCVVHFCDCSGCFSIHSIGVGLLGRDPLC